MVQSNPYHPTPGQLPEALTGRDDHLQWWQVCVRDAKALGYTFQRSQVITGIRGVGKTALANQLARDARAQGWTVAWRQASGSDPEPDTNAILHTVTGEEAELPSGNTSYRATGATVGVAGFEAAVEGELVSGSTVRASDRMVLATLRKAAEQAGERSAGVLIVVDEAQVMDPPSLKQLGAALHQLSQDGERTPPVIVVLAGLPGLRKRVFDAITHTDRLFDFTELRNLSAADVARALVSPAKKRGVRWSEEAIAYVAAQTRGYPTFVQEYGNAIFAAKRRDLITLEDALEGERRAQERINTQFESVWLKASPLGKRYLEVLARHGGHAPSAVIAGELGRTTPQLSSLLASFKNRGDLHHNDAGEVELSRPGMDAWIRGLGADDLEDDADKQELLDELGRLSPDELRRLLRARGE